MTESPKSDVETILNAISELEKKVMSGLTDLQTATTALTAAVSAAATELQALATAATGDPDATVETFAQQVNAQAVALQTAVTAA
jgi:hypothetical protein